MKQRPEKRGRIPLISSHDAIRIAILHHHGGKIGGFLHDPGRIPDGAPPRLFHPSVSFAKKIKIV
jgi:hypothetical protein